MMLHGGYRDDERLTGRVRYRIQQQYRSSWTWQVKNVVVVQVEVSYAWNSIHRDKPGTRRTEWRDAVASDFLDPCSPTAIKSDFPTNPNPPPDVRGVSRSNDPTGQEGGYA